MTGNRKIHSGIDPEFIRNSAGTVGIYPGKGEFWANHERHRIFPHRLQAGYYPVFHHGYAFGGRAVLAHRDVPEPYLSPRMKHWSSLFGILNGYVKTELVKADSPEVSVGPGFKRDLPIFG